MMVGREFPAELIPAGIIQPAVLSLAVGPCPVLIFPGCHSSRGRSVAFIADEVVLAPRTVSLGTLCCLSFEENKKDHLLM